MRHGIRLNTGGTRGKRLPPDDEKMARHNKTNFSSVFELMLEDNRRQLRELQVQPVVVPKTSWPIASSLIKPVSAATSAKPIRVVGLTDGKSFTFEL